MNVLSRMSFVTTMVILVGLLVTFQRRWRVPAANSPVTPAGSLFEIIIAEQSQGIVILLRMNLETLLNASDASTSFFIIPGILVHLF
jgi:hypothetical protein